MKTSVKILAATILVVSLAGCVSTGNAKQPYRTWTIHEWAFGHQRYELHEKLEARCIYRNQLPSGIQSGFSRGCRMAAAQRGIPMGINSAMWAQSCKIDLCRASVHAWLERQPAASLAAEQP